MQQEFSFVSAGPLFDDDFVSRNGAKIFLANSVDAFTRGLSELSKEQEMSDLYRGFEINRMASGIHQIFERGKLIDDAASETASYDRVDAILRERSADDKADNARNYRR